MYGETITMCVLAAQEGLRGVRANSGLRLKELLDWGKLAGCPAWWSPAWPLALSGVEVMREVSNRRWSEPVLGGHNLKSNGRVFRKRWFLKHLLPD